MQQISSRTTSEKSKLENEYRKKCEMAKTRLDSLQQKEKQYRELMTKLSGNSEKRIADLQSALFRMKQQYETAQKRIRGSYKLVSPEQKVMIHEYAEKHGVKAASKLFQVAPSTIASWLYQKPNGERTSAIRNKEAHSRILEWIQTRQENGERVNNRDFHSYALSTMRELTGNPDFAASRSWCSNFLKKYNIQLDR